LVPKFHRWHHTSEDEGLDKNFAGLFPLFDILSGTYYMPEERLPERFGLNADNAPQTFWGQMISPFRNQSLQRKIFSSDGKRQHSGPLSFYLLAKDEKQTRLISVSRQKTKFRRVFFYPCGKTKCCLAGKNFRRRC
jgi:hypothetical protein